MKAIFAAALVAGTMMGFGIANAAPMVPTAPASQGDIIHVAGGCGPGMHRGAYGRCRINRGRIVVVPPRMVRPARRCPPGMFWRQGRCWR